jgi:hypothetical protein
MFSRKAYFLYLFLLPHTHSYLQTFSLSYSKFAVSMLDVTSMQMARQFSVTLGCQEPNQYMVEIGTAWSKCNNLIPL